MLNRLLKPIAHKLPESNRLERIWVLAKTDFLKRYYGSFLGVAWAFINPFFRLIIYYSVFTLVTDPTEQNFALFLFIGLIVYLFFMESVQKSLRIFTNNLKIFENIRIEKLDLYFAGIISAFFGFLFNLSGFLVMNLLFDTEFSSQVWLFPLVLLTLVIFILGVMLLFSIIQTFFKDFIHIWNLIAMALLWLSGIFFEINPELTWKAKVLAYLTPLPGIIMNSRNLLMDGELIDWGMLFYSFSYSIIVLIIGYAVFRKYSIKAIEKM